MGLEQKIRYQWGKNNNAVARLVLINVAFTLFAWLMMWGIGNDSLFQLPAKLKLVMFRPYTLVTYMFSHAGIMHLLFNMLILYFIGQSFESLYGSKKTYKVYLYSGIFAGIAFVVIYNLQVLFETGAAKDLAQVFVDRAFLVGASGAIMGIVFALAWKQPNLIFKLYGIFSIKLWWIAAAWALLDIFGLMNNNNFGGRIAHLAGGSFGILMINFWHGSLAWPRFLQKKPLSKTFLIQKNNANIFQKNNFTSRPSQAQVDEILDKINEKGYNNLTKQEKELLFRIKDD